MRPLAVFMPPTREYFSEGILAELRPPTGFRPPTMQRVRPLPRWALPKSLTKAVPPPREADFAAPPPNWAQRNTPWAKRQYEIVVRNARERYETAEVQHAREEARRLELLQQAIAGRDEAESARKQAVADAKEAHRASSEKWRERRLETLRRANNRQVASYFFKALESSSYPAALTRRIAVRYVAESRVLVVDCQIPSYRAEREALYRSIERDQFERVVAQIALRSVWELYAVDLASMLDAVVMNVLVSTVDEATGNHTRPVLCSVRTDRQSFSRLKVQRVDPLRCLAGLGALLSTDAARELGVRPLDTATLSRANATATGSTVDLMDLSPREFEVLVTGLFMRMGLETEITKETGDGGVDCVAYDRRPVLGGKVIIQAKRYLGTVGPSYARDLYGTMVSEGAIKGVLVSTGGFGPSAQKFCDGKPIELVAGSDLVRLLHEFCGIDAMIPDPAPHARHRQRNS